MGRKSSRPRVRFQGVQPVETRAGTWKFRARTRHRGKVFYGSLRSTQEEAAEDYLLRVKELDPNTPTLDTLGEALQAVISAAARRGVKDKTLNSHYKGHARYLLKYFETTTFLRKVSVDDVLWFIGEARGDGRAANTLIEKDLPLLSRAFEVARRLNPVPHARTLSTLKKTPRQKDRLEYPEALAFIERIRSEKVLDKRGVEITLPRRLWHADLVSFLLFTGARNGELANLNVEDIKGQVIHLNGKTGPRTVAIHSALAPVLDRLVKDANDGGREEIVPHGDHSSLSQVVGRWAKRLDVKVHSRALRHTLAFAMFDTPNVTLADVQAQLGHAQATTTNQYLRQRQQANPNALEKVSLHFEPPSEPDAQVPKSDMPHPEG